MQIPVLEYIKSEHGVDCVDVVTELGPNKILSGNENKTTIELIKSKVKISVEAHRSKLIAIVGHYDCAGNPTDKKTQLVHIAEAIKTVKSWDFKVKIIGLWVDRNWRVWEVQ